MKRRTVSPKEWLLKNHKRFPLPSSNLLLCLSVGPKGLHSWAFLMWTQQSKRSKVLSYSFSFLLVFWHFSWLFSLCSSSFSRRIVGFLFTFLLFWIIVLMLVVSWRLLLMPRGPLEAALGTIIFHQQRNRDIVSVSSFYVTGNKERTIHCQRLVWISGCLLVCAIIRVSWL